MLALGPVNFSPVLSGYVADKYGWRTNFWIMTAFVCCALLLVIFACPETSYHRPLINETDINSTEELPITETAKTASQIVVNEKESDDSAVSLDKASAHGGGLAGQDTSDQPRTFVQELRPFRGRISHDSPFVLLARLFTCALYPAVIWSFLVGGTYVAWVRTASNTTTFQG